MDSRDPWVRETRGAWELSILVGGDGMVGLLDVEVRSPDGRRWLGTVGTISEIERLMKRWRDTHECLDGKYFYVVDLVIVDVLSEQGIFDVMADLIRTDNLSYAFTEFGPDGMSVPRML